ncbi:VC0807 family protein [Streptomyces sp. SID2999]|uniref:VC0807 family protein n=1 Tax=Streptomyces sp. SID2999 TaxID=2690258 RepID=UPI001F47BFA0|nr:VC0807 family protein [Streptomyces sp. SID2999]
MTKNTGNQGQDEQRQGQHRPPSALENFKPLLLDVALPLGSYYVFKEALGMSTFAALAWSSVGPALRTVWSLVRKRSANGLALLILTVNVVGLALSFVSGDPRLMLAKDGAVSSTVALGILVSVALGRPMMTEGMKPFLVKGNPAREGAWQRLTSGAARGSADFRRKERAFSLVWGVALLIECVVRVVGAYTIPVDTMVWLGGVLMAVVMVVTFVVSGAVAAGPMERMVCEEADAKATEPAETAQDGRTELTTAA